MRLVIVGAGGLARTIYSVFKDQYEFIGFYEQPQYEGETIYGLPVSHNLGDRHTRHVIGVCANPYEKLIDRDDRDHECLFHWQELIHPTTHISPFAKVGEGNIFMPHIHVDPEAEIGRLNTFMNGCFIGHHAKIGDYCTIGQNTVIGGYTKVEDLCLIGSNVSIINEHWRENPITLGRGCRVGSNAVVVKRTVRDGETVVGIPARPIR